MVVQQADVTIFSLPFLTVLWERAISPEQLRRQLWNFLAHLPTMRPYNSEATPILCGGQPYNFLEHMTKCTVVPVSDHGGDLFYGMS
jgi:hypothetical protein